jgi:hypothetical protein
MRVRVGLDGVLLVRGRRMRGHGRGWDRGKREGASGRLTPRGRTQSSKYQRIFFSISYFLRKKVEIYLPADRIRAPHLRVALSLPACLVGWLRWRAGAWAQHHVGA